MSWSRRTRLSMLLVAMGRGFWPRPAIVDKAQVARDPLVIAVQLEGKTRVIDRCIVSAPVTGFATRIAMDFGDKVNKI